MRLVQPGQIESLKLYAAARAICDVMLAELRDQRDRGFSENIYPIEKLTAFVVSLRCAAIPLEGKTPGTYLADARSYLALLDSHFDAPGD